MPYKRPNSKDWWISYTDGSGRRVRRSAGTANHAEAKAIEARLKAEGFERRQQGDPNVSFAVLMLAYLKDTEGKRSADRDRVITAHLRDHFGGLDMTKIKPSDVRTYMDARREVGKADSTIAREIALLSAAINHYCNEHGISLPNPVKGRKPKQGEGRVRWISREEAGTLIAAANRTPYLADFIRLGLHTGMRKQELLGLEWSRVNLGERLIFLEGSHTKSGRRRTIPINEAARVALLARWNWTRKHAPDTRWVFCAEDGKRIANVRKSFLTACAKAGIADFRIHDMRHTCAAWLVSSGASLSAVRDLLGHRTVTTTEIYAHLAPTAVREAVGKLDACHAIGHTDLMVVATGGLEPPTPAL